MGLAMLKGWLADGISPKNIYVQDPYPSAELSSLDIQLNPKRITMEALPFFVVVLAIKPQLAQVILPKLFDNLSINCPVISILAGISLSYLQDLTQHKRMIRAMPNIPATVGCSMTVLCPSDEMTHNDQRIVDSVMQSIGDTCWIESENMMDAVTAISGSGPAYIFYMVEALAEAGCKLGLPQHLAVQLAHKTVAGSGMMLHSLKDTAEQLRINVSSPGGTTLAALSVLMDNQTLSNLMYRTALMAIKRSRQLTDEAMCEE